MCVQTPSREKLAICFYCWSKPGGECQGNITSSFGLLGQSQSAPSYRLIRSWPIRQQLGKCAIKPLRESLGDELFACYVCAKLREDSHRGWLCTQLTTVPLFAMVLWDSWMQALFVFRAMWFGTFHHSLKPATSGRWEHGQNSGFHEQEPIATLLSLWS